MNVCMIECTNVGGSDSFWALGSRREQKFLSRRGKVETKAKMSRSWKAKGGKRCVLVSFRPKSAHLLVCGCWIPLHINGNASLSWVSLESESGCESECVCLCVFGHKQVD